MFIYTSIQTWTPIGYSAPEISIVIVNSDCKFPVTGQNGPDILETTKAQPENYKTVVFTRLLLHLCYYTDQRYVDSLSLGHFDNININRLSTMNVINNLFILVRSLK